jgi:probable phosphoglycerate mutase
MTHLYLIRHGQVDGLQPGIVGSVTSDSGLSRLGIVQAERLRDRLAITGEIQADVPPMPVAWKAKE